MLSILIINIIIVVIIITIIIIVIIYPNFPRNYLVRRSTGILCWKENKI